MSAKPRLRSKRELGAEECERCGWPLLVSAYRNGKTKCGVCYGVEKGYYEEGSETDRLEREPPEWWLNRNSWFVEGGDR